MDIFVVWAFILGVMCSVSLLIGALLGIYLKMSKRIVGLMAAFGAGALLSALAIELVAPSINAFMQASSAETRAMEVRNFFHLVVGAFAYCAFPGVQEDLTVELDGRLRVKSGQVLALSLPTDACYLFDVEGRAWRRHVKAERMLAA